MLSEHINGPFRCLFFVRYRCGVGGFRSASLGVYLKFFFGGANASARGCSILISADDGFTSRNQLNPLTFIFEFDLFSRHPQFVQFGAGLCIFDDAKIQFRLFEARQPYTAICSCSVS